MADCGWFSSAAGVNGSVFLARSDTILAACPGILPVVAVGAGMEQSPRNNHDSSPWALGNGGAYGAPLRMSYSSLGIAKKIR